MFKGRAVSFRLMGRQWPTPTPAQSIGQMYTYAMASVIANGKLVHASAAFFTA